MLAIGVGGALIVWVGICLVETIHEVVALLFDFHILVIALEVVIPLFLSYFLDVLLRVLCLIRALMAYPLWCLFEGIHDVVSEVPALHLLDPCPPLP